MTQNRYLVSLFVLVVLVMASLACNAGAATPTEEVMVATEQPTVEPASETPVEPTADTAIAAEPACPTPTDGTLLYRSDEFGYCFLYPATYTLNPDWNIYEYGVTGVYGTPLDPTAMESLAVSVEVFYNGPAADVSTANEYASKWVQVSGILPEDGSFETSSLGGNDAVIVIGQPGMFSQQTAYAVVDGRK